MMTTPPLVPGQPHRIFEIGEVVGFVDSLGLWLRPRKLRARFFAKRLLKQLRTAPSGVRGSFVFRLRGEFWEIIDAAGRVAPWTR